MDTFEVTFTPKKLEAFKRELAKYSDDNAVFVFEEKRWLVAYARYLAGYLEGVFFAGRQEYKSDT